MTVIKFLSTGQLVDTGSSCRVLVGSSASGAGAVTPAAPAHLSTAEIAGAALAVLDGWRTYQETTGRGRPQRRETSQ